NIGQLGLGINTSIGRVPGQMGDALAPVALGTGRTAVAIRSKFNHTCALLDDASVKCWGWNITGQLGLGDTADRGDAAAEMGDALPAVSLGTGRTALSVTTGITHTCARLDDGSLKCWGQNDRGQLGLGDNVTRGDGAGEMGDALPVTVVAGSIPALSINDISQSEGDIGTTTFTFQVTLSSPALAGGVTFDIATADGTAQDGNPVGEDEDYVAKSLSVQTIPAGSAGPYEFTVTVNGDVEVEGDETFFVNVTNVTGATVLDGQGQGTILNEISESDYAILFDLRDNHGFGVAFGWPTTTVPCPQQTFSWPGVTCNDGRVTIIAVGCNAPNFLTTPFPGTQIAGLTELFSFELRGCYQTPQPASNFAPLDTMTQLTELQLDENIGITGTIDDIFPQGLSPTRFPVLSLLDLNSTSVGGQIPASVMDFGPSSTIALAHSAYSGTLPATGSPPFTTRLSDNAFEGVLPDYIRNAVRTEGRIRVRYNKFDVVNTPPGNIDTIDPGWRDTQTVPPTNIQVTPNGVGSATLTWTPIAYQAHGGYYEVLSATTPGGPYTTQGTTSSTGAKTAMGLEVSGLPAGTNYFVVRTFTPAHTGVYPGVIPFPGCGRESHYTCASENNPNDLTSVNSAEVSAAIADNETTVTVTGGNLLIEDTNGGTTNDTLTLSCQGTPDSIFIHDPNNPLTAVLPLTQVNANTVAAPVAGFSGGWNITVNTLGGNDTLTVNLSACTFFPPGGVFFNGGTQSGSPGDTLNIIGGSTTTQTFNFTNENDGSVVLTGAVAGTINYTGLEPVSSTITAANVVLNYSTATEIITVTQDGGTPAQTLVDSDVGGESVSFLNPTTSLQINGGDTGDDTINVNGFGTSGGGFTANLTINGGTGNDTVNLNADINFAGGNSLDVDLQNDDASPGIDAVSVGANANLITSGAGTITVKVSRSVAMASGSSFVVENGNLTVEANQQMPTPTSGDFVGVDVFNGLIQATGTGAVTVQGKGGDTRVLFNQMGVRVRLGARIIGGTSGLLTVQGTGGGSTGPANIGVDVFAGPGATITSSGGDVLVKGTGGGVGASGQNYGVIVRDTGIITAMGSGTITVEGQGGNLTGTGEANDGVVVTASGGPIGGTIANVGSGNTTITGTAGGTSGIGVFIEGPNSNVTVVDGDLTITGTAAGTTTGFYNAGVLIQVGAKVSSTGTGVGAGLITITGTGGGGTSENYGVDIEGGTPAVTSVDGNIQITGTAGAGGAANNTFAITLGYPGNAAESVTSTGTANLTLISDSLRIVTASASVGFGSNTVNIRPKTAGTAIDLGGADSATALGLTDAELDRITAGEINIGNAVSGPITTSADITRAAATKMTLVSDGDVVISGGQVNTGGGTLLLDPGVSPNAVRPTKALTDVTASTLSFGSDLAIAINGPTVDTQYDQLNVVGAVNLTGVSLALSGSHVSTVGQQFVIVNNDGADAITGTFNGLAQGAIIPNFLGASGVNAAISYIGGTGNDAVITACTTDPEVTNLIDSGAGSLRDAVFNACPGSTITFAPAVTGTITLTSGQIVIDKNLTITGPGASTLAISGSNSSRIFSVGSFAFNLSNLTLRNGNGVGTPQSTSGGAIFSRGGSVVITSSVIAGSTGSIGGGLYNRGGTLTILDSTISGNSTTSFAGGITSISFTGDPPAVTTITNSTISGNESFFGGGIFNQGATLIMVNSTVSANVATGSDPAGDGGGLTNIGFGGAATATITNCTFAGNQQTGTGTEMADEIYSGNFGAQSTVTLRNTIIGGSSATTSPNLNVFTDDSIPALGIIASQGYNLSTDNGGGFLTGIADQINTDPLLAPLADNGGPTMTHALLHPSPAIDAGNNFGVLTDQRGQTRPFDQVGFANATDGTDIGAYEEQVQFIIPTTTAVSSDNNPSIFGQAVTFTATVATIPPGMGTPTGTVTFNIDGNLYCVNTPLTGSTATCTQAGLPALPAGNRVVVAIYNGDGIYNGSVGSLAGGQVVNMADTLTTITSDLPDPSSVNQPYTVTWTVVPDPVQVNSGSPTGTVTIDGGTDGGSCMAPVAAGSCQLTPTTVGTKTIQATYSGDANFNGSVSATTTHDVNMSITGTVRNGLTNAPVAGEPMFLVGCANLTTATDAAGMFTFTGPFTGDCFVFPNDLYSEPFVRVYPNVTDN
ncbi:MAG: choice-of-anchor Q domain-containing protein, partial [Pyrinomonadaceae bacterium]